jgi:phosphate/sulfate permease
MLSFAVLLSFGIIASIFMAIFIGANDIANGMSMNTHSTVFNNNNY